MLPTMVDIFSLKKRSEIMSRVKSRNNRATELRLVQVLKDYRIIGWRRRSRIIGSPDFVFPSQRVALFVDGCFWHGCPIHGSMPQSNRKFWKAKLTRNKKRDCIVNSRLRKVGWTVIRIWQHDLARPEKVASRISKLLTALTDQAP